MSSELNRIIAELKWEDVNVKADEITLDDAEFFCQLYTISTPKGSLKWEFRKHKEDGTCYLSFNLSIDPNDVRDVRIPGFHTEGEIRLVVMTADLVGGIKWDNLE